MYNSISHTGSISVITDGIVDFKIYKDRKINSQFYTSVVFGQCVRCREFSTFTDANNTSICSGCEEAMRIRIEKIDNKLSQILL